MERVVGTQGLNATARFLDIGGNSLNLVEVLKQIKHETGAAPSPRMFFHREDSTIAAISSEIDTQVYASQSNQAVVNQ